MTHDHSLLGACLSSQLIASPLRRLLNFPQSLAPLLCEPQLGGGLDDDLHHLVRRLGGEAARVVLGPESVDNTWHGNNSHIHLH